MLFWPAILPERSMVVNCCITAGHALGEHVPHLVQLRIHSQDYTSTLAIHTLLTYCHCLAVTTSLSQPHCDCLAVTTSLSQPHCDCLAVTTSLSQPHCDWLAVTTSLSQPHCHYILSNSVRQAGVPHTRSHASSTEVSPCLTQQLSASVRQ